MEAVQTVKIFPIVTHFMGTSVRFFPMRIEREMGSRNVTPSLRKIDIETQGIPLPDYVKAINYHEHGIRRMIKNNNNLFEYFYKTETIPDSLGRPQPTIIMAIEMCDMLTAKFHTSKIKDPIIRSKVIEFQLWTMLMFGMIRRGQLRPIHVPKDAGIPYQVYDFLALKEHKGRGKFVNQACNELGWNICKFYKRVNLARESSSIPPEATKKTGQPRKTRANKDSFIHYPEFQQVKDYIAGHPGAGGKEIQAALGIPYSTSSINRWVRYILGQPTPAPLPRGD